MKETKPDLILIDQLELSARIGVPELERAQPQRLTVTLALQPQRDFSALEDRIEHTVDYHRVCLAVQATAAEKPRRLLETLTEEIARMLLRNFPLAAVEVELRKFILPETNFVAVKIRRERGGA